MPANSRWDLIQRLKVKWRLQSFEKSFSHWLQEMFAMWWKAQPKRSCFCLQKTMLLHCQHNSNGHPRQE